MAKNYLTRDEILAVDDLQVAEVEVPEWGGTVRIQGLTGEGRDEFQISLMAEPGKSMKLALDNATVKLLVRTIVDEGGKPMFSAMDIKALGKKSGAALNRCYEVAQRLSGLSNKDIQELTENFKSGQSEDSTSG